MSIDSLFKNDSLDEGGSDASEDGSTKSQDEQEEIGDIEEAREENEGNQEGEKAEDVLVIKAKLAEEQGYRQRLARELKEAKQEVGSLREQFKTELLTLREIAKAKSEKQEKEEVDPEKDPVLYITSMVKDLKAELEDLKNQNKNSESKSEVTNAVNELKKLVDRSFQSYASKEPSFKDAVEFLRKSRVDELGAFGYSEEEAEAIIDNDMLLIGKRALELEQSPASMIHKIAKQRGFRTKEEVTKNQQRISDGMSKNKTLGNASGKNASVGDVSLQQMLNASDDEFDKLWEKKFGS